MIFANSTVTTDRFLAEYWQKKPLLLRQAFPGFEPPLDADDIAGLACDEMAESRLVTGSFENLDWEVRYGPFREKELRRLPETNWTLLVQDVEKHYPPLQELLEDFGFLPRWRIDDLMVSVAGPGGSVGPHVDQYDVFLLQAAGARRWEISETFDPELLPDCDLKVLRRFSAEQSWLLQPGDLLYLPPGVAHHGVAVDAGMTWSIGMRAPSAADFFLSLGEWLSERPDEGGRYRDPPLESVTSPGAVEADSIAQWRDFPARALAGDSEFESFLGSFLSRYRLAHEPAPPADPVTPDALRRSLQSGGKLRHNPWTRLLWLESEGNAQLFAAGSAFPCPRDFARDVCDPARLARLGPDLADADAERLCGLLNRGHLYIEPL